VFSNALLRAIAAGGPTLRAFARLYIFLMWAIHLPNRNLTAISSMMHS